MSMNRRIPKLFRKALPEKKFLKKIRKRIYVKREQEFIDSVMPVGEDGYRRLKESPTDEEIKRLRKLAKEIKKNRGVLTTWKLAVIAVFFGAIIVFNLLFKDVLVERIAERNLQSLFQARVDMVEPHVSIFGASISFESLTVADKERPFKNLFELGHTELSVHLYQLLRGRVVIKTAESREIRFGTERETSGLIETAERDADGGESRGEDPGSGSGTSEILQDLGSRSVEKLIGSYENRLESPAFVEETNERLQDSIVSWNERIENTGQQIEELRTEAQRLVERDPRSFESVEEAKDYIDLLKEKQRRVEEIYEEASEMRKEFREDTEFAGSLDERFKDVIDKDIAFLEEAMGSFGIDVRNAVSSTAKPLIREALGRSYDYTRKALSTAKEVRNRSAGRKPAYAKDRGRVGSTIRYPTEHFPRFLLETFYLSFGRQESRGEREFSVRDIAFDPDEWKRPISLSYRSTPEGRRTDISAEIDLRSESEIPLDAEAIFEDYPVRIDTGLSELSLESFEGLMDNRIDFSLDSISEGEGNALITFKEARFDFSDDSGPITEALRDIFSEIDTVDFEVAFTFENNTIDSLSVETDLDRILRDRLGAYLKELADEAAARVERELRAYIQSYLEKNRDLRNALNVFEEEIVGQVREAESIDELLETQQEKAQAFVEGKLDEAKARAQEAKRQAEEEAKERAEEQKKKLEQERDKQLDKAKDKVKELF